MGLAKRSGFAGRHAGAGQPARRDNVDGTHGDVEQEKTQDMGEAPIHAGSVVPRLNFSLLLVLDKPF